MSFVGGISLSSLAPGSNLSLSVLSVEDPSYSLALEESIGQAPTEHQALQSAFERLSKSLSQKLEHVIFTLPIYFTDAEKELVYSAAKAAGWAVPRKLDGFLDHVQSYHRSSIQENYSVQNELVLDISPSAAGSRLLSAEVEENIRMSNQIAQTITFEAQSNADELVRSLVDPALAALQASPSVAGSTLKRIIIVASFPTIVPIIVEKLQSRFNSSVEVIVALHPSQDAATIALAASKWSLEDLLVFNVAVLRIGVAKSDGFVLTLLPKNFTLPNHRSAILTTSKDNQTTVTIQIVAGVSPHVKNNTVVAELILEGLAPRPKGTTLIRVSLDVDQMGPTKILAEEIDKEREFVIQKTVELKNPTGDMTEDDIEAYWYGTETEAVLAEEAAEADWAGNVAQGDLPE